MPNEALGLFTNTLICFCILAAVRSFIGGELWTKLAVILIGAACLFWLSPRIMVFYIFYWGVVLGFLKIISFPALIGRERVLNILMTAAIFVILLPMVVWKLVPESFALNFSATANDALGVLHQHLKAIDSIAGIAVPLGLSFATFRALDLVIKQRVGLLVNCRALDVFYYGLFPAIISFGPVAEIKEIDDKERLTSQVSNQDIAVGIMRLALGAVKVFLAAPLLAPSLIGFTRYSAISTFEVWQLLFFYSWYLYLNFSGFSDLSIGATRLIGLRLAENFDNPYFKSSPAKFWAAWHMSLTRFAQRNVFMAMKGYRAERQYVALATTMMVIALWHDPTPSLVIFGIYHAGVLITERALNNRQKRPSGLKPPAWQLLATTLATYLYVMVSLPLLNIPFGGLAIYYGKLFGIY